MADDPKKSAHDRKLVSLMQLHEVRYWTRQLGVTSERLREAIKAVGRSAAKIRAYMATDRFSRGE